MPTPNQLYITRTSVLNGINGVGKALRSIGLDPFKLKADAIIRKAKKHARYSGEMPGQTEPGLKVMIDSIVREGKPNPFGALATGKMLERFIYGRLKVEQELAARPEITRADIKSPVFIVGMPRTGTTILHAMMHQDPAHRAPLAWECLLPHPVPRPENYTDNEQKRKIEKDFDQLFKMVPDFRTKHYMEADSPQECLGINMFDMNSFQIIVQFFMPSYTRWFNNRSDKLETMRFHKRFLQYLQSGGVIAERWLLKTPVHLMRLPELFEVYPDAHLIMTHRDPEKIVPSIASLLTSVRSLYSDTENPARTAVEQLDIWSEYFKRFLKSIEDKKIADRIIHVKFDDFVKDQVGVVRRIYEQSGWELSQEALKNKEAFLKANPKDKNGVHIYSTEDFGLTKTIIRKKFGHYIDFLNTL